MVIFIDRNIDRTVKSACFRQVFRFTQGSVDRPVKSACFRQLFGLLRVQ
jgi:hypothetical protein